MKLDIYTYTNHSIKLTKKLETYWQIEIGKFGDALEEKTFSLKQQNTVREAEKCKTNKEEGRVTSW